MILYIDISNFVATRSHTGIQRVIREFLHRLLQNNHTLAYKVIFYNEDASLFNIITPNALSHFLEETKTYEFSKDLETLSFTEIKSGNIFFDMDGVWNNSLKRPFLYKILHQNGVKIMNFIYDLVPVILPQYSHYNTIRNYVAFLYAVYQYSDMVFFDSRSAEEDFSTIQSQIHNQRIISTRVIKLGSDIFHKIDKTPNAYQSLLEKQYILFVGTLEPRKNQTLMLDVLEKLTKQYPHLNLILVGKEGWNNQTLIRRLEKHKLLNKTLHWLQDVDDNILSTLYQNAHICVYISAYEGFGLPVAESLSYGNITISSKNSSMYEVGKNFADYLHYNSFNELHDTITTYLEDVTLYTYKKAFIKKHYKPYSWDLTFNSLLSVFENIQKDISITIPQKLQFVFISIDTVNLAGTIAALDQYVDFISEYIIVTRANLIPEFQTIASKYPMTLIDETVMLKEHAKGFNDKDHQSKNWLLRASLLNIDKLDNQFIMLDDDNRPIRQISLSHFIDNGKYNAYYFYNLLEWSNQSSAYDKGQKCTQDILDSEGYELLSYAAHKPQIIDKHIFKEVVNHYFEYGLTTPIDEWSTYFNYAISHYPFLFQKKKFDVLNWPANPSDWDWHYTPDVYHFENYYEASYTEGIFNTSTTPSLEDKLVLKEQQVAPYLKNIQMKKTYAPYYQVLNTVHGVLPFKQNNNAFYCYGLPYYLEVVQGSWIKLSLNYKFYGFYQEKIELAYWISGQEGARTTIHGEYPNYNEGIVSFAISATSLQKQKYTLFIDLYIDDEPLYGTASPYMIELNVL